MGLNYVLPNQNPQADSLRLQLISGGPLIFAWWDEGKVKSGDAHTHPGTVNLRIPEGADSVSIYPIRDFPQPLFSRVEAH